jgi:hypothetical protein
MPPIYATPATAGLVSPAAHVLHPSCGETGTHAEDHPITLGRNGRRGGAAQAEAFPVPSYLPPAAWALLPFARAYAVAAARRYQLPLADCWDEAITALVRAAVYFRPGAGRFHAYARIAIRRGLWRYCRRPTRTTRELAAAAGTMPDTETLLIALENGVRPVHCTRRECAHCSTPLPRDARPLGP